MRYFISISYKGSSYFGWQIQPSQPSVQETLSKAFSVYLGGDVEITGAGRTDTGVHAVNYIAHFDFEELNLQENYRNIIYKINAILPSDIVLNDICQVEDDSHSRFDAVSRTYKYYIHTRKNPFVDDFSLYCPYNPDLEKMNLAAKSFLGKQDFTSLAKLHGSAKTNICTVTKAEWVIERQHPLFPTSAEEGQAQYLCFEVTADRFLRNMVRSMVGSLLEVGRGKNSAEWIKEMLEKKNRCEAGNSVQAKALFLCGIEYPYQLFKNNKEINNK